MPFDVKLDKFNRERMAWLLLLYGMLTALSYLARMYFNRYLPVLGLTIGLTGLLFAATHVIRHGRWAGWLYLLIAVIIVLLPSDNSLDLLRQPGAAADWPATADAAYILKTNIQRIQHTLLQFTDHMRRLIVIDHRQTALAFVLAAVLFVTSRLLRKAILHPRAFRSFEAAVWLFYEMPDRLSRYIAMEILLSLYAAAGWLIALTLLDIPHAFELALLFGLGAVTPKIGLLWGAGLVVFFLPWQHAALLQFLGLIIAFAVIWLGKFLLFSRPLAHTRHHHPAGVVLACFIAGLVFVGYAGAFFAWPLYAIAHIMATHVQRAALAFRRQEARVTPPHP